MTARACVNGCNNGLIPAFQSRRRRRHIKIYPLRAFEWAKSIEFLGANERQLFVHFAWPQAAAQASENNAHVYTRQLDGAKTAASALRRRRCKRLAARAESLTERA